MTLGCKRAAREEERGRERKREGERNRGREQVEKCVRVLFGEFNPNDLGEHSKPRFSSFHQNHHQTTTDE